MIQDWPLADAIAARHPDVPGYRILVRDLRLSVSIGIHAHEKRQRARICVNVDLLIAAPLPRNDDFAEVVNYETVVEGIKRLGEGKHVNLVESFADRIADLCFSDPRTRAVRVRVEKLDIYAEAASVGVVIERHRPEA